MGRDISLTAGAVTAGLAAAALLSAGAAFAAGGEDGGSAAGGAVTPTASTSDTGSDGTTTTSSGADTGGDGSDGGTSAASGFPDVPGHDAFSIGNFTFDPFSVVDGKEVEGFTPVDSLFGIPPVADIGGGEVSLLGTSLPLADQAFDVYSAGKDPSLLGVVDTNENTANILGMTNTELIVSHVDAADGVKDSALPADGTVYDVFNLGGGIENVYIDVPGKDGGTVSDVLHTPLGNIDLSSLFGNFDATEPIDPADAFTGLTGAATDATTSTVDGAAEVADPSMF